MFLFRPSNNNQRYAFVPLLDQSDTDDNEEFADGNEDKGGKRTNESKEFFLFDPKGQLDSLHNYHEPISRPFYRRSDQLLSSYAKSRNFFPC